MHKSLFFLSLPLLALATDGSNCTTSSQYMVKKDDTGIAISTANSVSTLSLLRQNNLKDDGTNLIAGSTICLPGKCKIHTIVTGESSTSIAAGANISVEDFRKYNPGVDPEGYGTFLIAGYNVCVSQPLEPTKPSKPTDPPMQSAVPGSAVNPNAPLINGESSALSGGTSSSGQGGKVKRAFTA